MCLRAATGQVPLRTIQNADPLKVDAAKALELASLAEVALYVLAQEEAQGSNPTPI